MKLKSFPILSFLILIGSPQLDAAETKDASLTMGFSTSCKIRLPKAGSNQFEIKDVDTLEAQMHVHQLVSNLRHMMIRGNLGSVKGTRDMEFYAAEIEGVLDSCAGKQDPYAADGNTFSCLQQTTPQSLNKPANFSTINQVCDYDCHLELGRFHTFMSGDFLYMREDYKKSSAADKLAKSHARFCGLPLVERGIQLASRLSGAQNPVSQFVTKNAALQMLKIRLLINSGDIDYQSVSGMQLKSMMAAVNKAIGTHDTSVEDSSSLLQSAYAAYDSALWTVIGLRTDIPDTATELLARLEGLEAQVRQRTDSIRRGRLFLNLDPDEFSTLPLDKIRSEIVSIQTAIVNAQAAINNLRQTGINEGSQLQTVSETELRTASNYGINIKTEKIAQLQAMLEKKRAALDESFTRIEGSILKDKAEQLEIKNRQSDFSAAIASWENEIADIRTGVARLNVEKTNTDLESSQLAEEIEAKRQTLDKLSHQAELLNANEALLSARFTWKRAEQEFKNEIAQISNLKDKELIALSRDRAAELESRYQWLTSLAMTRLNLEMQFKSLGGQITSSATRFNSAALNAWGKTLEYETLKNEYKITRKNLEISESKIGQLYIKKYFDSTLRKNNIRSRVCEYERELTFLGEPLTEGKIYKGRSVADTLPTEVAVGIFPGGDETKDVSNSQPSFVLFDSGRATPSAAACFANRSDLFARSKADISRFDELFNVDLPNSDKPVTLEPEVNGRQFSFFGGYNLPSTYTPDNVGFQRVSSSFDGHAEGTLPSMKKAWSDANRSLASACDIKPQATTELSYHNAICGNESSEGLRKALARTNEEQNRIFLECIYAETPSSEYCKSMGLSTNEIAFARKVYERHVAAAEKRKKTIKELKDILLKFQPVLKAVTASFQLLNGDNTSLLVQMVSTIKASTSVITTQSVGSCGYGPCAINSVQTNTSTALLAQLEVIKEKTSAAIDEWKVGLQVATELKDLSIAYLGFEDKLNEIDANLDQQEIARDRAIAEITGKRIQYSYQSAIDAIQKDIMIEDCRNEGAKWTDRVESIRFQHDQALAEFNREDIDALALDLEIAQERSRADQIFNQLQQVNFKITRLNAEIADLRTQARESLMQIENTTMQLCSVDSASKDVEGSVLEMDKARKLKLEYAAIYEEKVKAIANDDTLKVTDLWTMKSEDITRTMGSAGKLLQILGEKTGTLDAMHTFQARMLALTTKATDILNRIAQLGGDAEGKTKLQANLKQKIAELEVAQTKIESKILAQESNKNSLKEDFDASSKAVATEVIKLRDQVSGEVQSLADRMNGSGNQVQMIMTSQELMEDISMSVPDYVEAKKALIQRVNSYLNKLRSRINALTVVSNGQGLNGPGYVRSTAEIDQRVTEAYDALAGSSNSEPVINVTEAVIEIPARSAFMYDLMNNGTVKFQIAPVSAYETSGSRNLADQVKQQMASVGYLTLWSPEFERKNARIIGVKIATPAICPDTNAAAGKVKLASLGIGSILTNDSAGRNSLNRFVSSSPRNLAHIPVIHSIQDNGSGIAAWKKLFLPGGGLRIWNLEDLRSQERDLNLDLMGSPVMGAFELTAEEWLSNCTMLGKDLQMHFVISQWSEG